MDMNAQHSHLTAGQAAAWVNGAVALNLFALWVIRDRIAEIGWRSLVLPVAALACVAAGIAELALIRTAGLAALTPLARLELGEKS